LASSADGPKAFTRPLLITSLPKSLKSKLENYNREMPEERVYVQFDKPFYQPARPFGSMPIYGTPRI